MKKFGIRLIIIADAGACDLSVLKGVIGRVTSDGDYRCLHGSCVTIDGDSSAPPPPQHTLEVNIPPEDQNHG